MPALDPLGRLKKHPLMGTSLASDPTRTEDVGIYEGLYSKALGMIKGPEGAASEKLRNLGQEEYQRSTSLLRGDIETFQEKARETESKRATAQTSLTKTKQKIGKKETEARITQGLKEQKKDLLRYGVNVQNPAKDWWKALSKQEQRSAEKTFGSYLEAYNQMIIQPDLLALRNSQSQIEASLKGYNEAYAYQTGQLNESIAQLNRRAGLFATFFGV